VQQQQPRRQVAKKEWHHQQLPRAYTAAAAAALRLTALLLWCWTLPPAHPICPHSPRHAPPRLITPLILRALRR
jgi:hypothetical protein